MGPRKEGLHGMDCYLPVDVSANCLPCIASGSILHILAFLRARIERNEPVAEQLPPTSGISIRMSLHRPLELFRTGYLWLAWNSEVVLASTRSCLVGHCLSTRVIRFLDELYCQSPSLAASNSQATPSIPISLVFCFLFGSYFLSIRTSEVWFAISE